MTHEEPRIMFFHYWGGARQRLSRSIKGAFLVGGLPGVSSPVQN